ncbi:hypothetical protein N802_16690 [Knoellia sinensis KCTC 19936]|uniref:Copper transporter n=1 Tax=Knoellia sinensis KCTC 19936 TaxID=1385520 RepID=A0A0A0J8U7_9MICO|nr:copper transporter [Knoellia sinensis]KGN32462.1 hypothetical protein N802_16690 [Knoellia sinensis KCTC 19936]
MIDFRYHLVSIVSIFMALAVGIVLGAGPLEGQIGDTLTQEVTQLREDRAALRTQLDEARQATNARDEFTADARARLVGGTLAEKKIALVVLPSADADHVTAIAETLTAAGATIASRTTVEESWTPQDEEATQQIATVAAELRRAVGLPGAGTSEDSPLDAVLASALVASDASAASDAAKGALERLASENLIDLDAADLERAHAAVVVGAPIPGDAAAERDRVAARLAGLALALDEAGQGAVLASDVGVAGSAGASSVVRAARDDAGTSRALSTVDDVSSSLGQVSVVYALVQQIGGGVGQYGLGDGVSAGYPPIPAP